MREKAKKKSERKKLLNNKLLRKINCAKEFPNKHKCLRLWIVRGKQKWSFLLLLPDGVKVSSRECCLLCWAWKWLCFRRKKKKAQNVYCIYHTANKKTTKKKINKWYNNTLSRACNRFWYDVFFSSKALFQIQFFFSSLFFLQRNIFFFVFKQKKSHNKILPMIKKIIKKKILFPFGYISSGISIMFAFCWWNEEERKKHWKKS